MGYAAKIVKDSVSPLGHRLTTMEITFPRFVLAEFNTHRMLSRNSASSRAIPAKKLIDRVKNDPFIPIYWGKNQSGMQAKEEITGLERRLAGDLWLAARDAAVQHAEALMDQGLHKQIANRILEPFMWHTAIVTATEWRNFFGLRVDENAQPEIYWIAEMMQNMYASSMPTLLEWGEWHLPYVRDEDVDQFGGLGHPDLRKISAGRACRVSYLTHDGVRDPQKDIDLHDTLAKNGHMSPLEHVARPMDQIEYNENPWSGNFHGWHQYRKDFRDENDFSKIKEQAAL